MSLENLLSKEFDAEQLADLGKRAGYDIIQVKNIVSSKSFVVVYTKL